MADSNSNDRNLPASQRKLEKAKAEGQVARSRDLGHFAAIAGGGALLALLAPTIVGWLEHVLTRGLAFDAAILRTPEAMTGRLGDLGLGLVALVLPFGAAMVAIAVAGGFALSGVTWTFKPLSPRFEVLDPLAGIGRVLSKQQLIDALKASLLALVVGTIAGAHLQAHLDAYTEALALPLPAAIEATARTALGGLGYVVLALAAFAAIDVPLQRHLHAQRLKMSHQELKQEHKELEGNAEVKTKVRARMREMTKRRMIAAVPKADLVVMNPTHYAVALKYDETKMGAPRVVAKGADLLALRIRDVAKGAQVPVLEAPVLARALYAHAELDREIPAALFAAVAQVLAYVYQLRAALAGRGKAPEALPVLDVPAELDPHNQEVPTWNR
jgi:flagellar biosynthetic protein FlhB